MRRRQARRHTVESGVGSGERGDRVELGVHVWRFTGPLDGWQRVAIVRGISVAADDPVALGEAQAKDFAEANNRELDKYS